MSKRLQCVAALVVLCAAVDVYASYSKTQDFRAATAEELAMKSVASAPGAPAAILEWVRIDDDTKSFSSEYYRIKIFSEEGRKYADLEVPYSPGHPSYGRVTEIGARTIRPDGTIVPFDGKVFEKTLFKGGGVKVRAKTFTLPDVQPGSIIEYRFIRRWTDHLLFNTSWPLQYDVPLLRARLTLKPYDSKGEYGSYFTHFGLPPGKLPVKVRDQYELEMENMPSYEKEAFSPPERQLKAYVNFYYTSSYLRPDEFWPAEAKNWTERIEDFIGKPKAAKNVAQQYVTPEPAETAKKIYAYVQTLRNYSFEASKSEQELDRQSINASKNVAEVLKKGAGFRDEINRAFVALARAAGLQADAVRVASRDTLFFSQAIPDPEQMGGEVSVVTIDGQPLFLDPGTPFAPFGTVSWEKSNVPGIRVSRGKPPEWVTVPMSDPKAAVLNRVADLNLDGETLAGTVVVTFTGQEALMRRLRDLAENDEARKKAFEEEARGWFAEGASVKLASLAGEKSSDDALVATFNVSLPNLVATAGSRTVVPISIFAASAPNPFAPTTRTNAVYFQYPRTEEDEVKLSIPDSLRVSAVPPKSNLDAGALGYKTQVKAEDRSVTFKRTMFVNTMLVEAKHYGSLRNFFGTMMTADQKPLVLVAKE